MIVRYNMYQSATVNANLRPGISSGQAIEALHRTAAAELESGMRTEWTELALLQLMTGNIMINGQPMNEGDGVAIEAENELFISGNVPSGGEFLLFRIIQTKQNLRVTD